jgi:hypothetical protein
MPMASKVEDMSVGSSDETPDVSETSSVSSSKKPAKGVSKTKDAILSLMVGERGARKKLKQAILDKKIEVMNSSV